ncbi:protein BTG4 isoform X2 [Limanda limanda]|uniref:protein BTG4 isoform X2 n=1 Tax=Limanda limanda TaxID=27771 RepID=UPI0029C8A372|nr:protein BTG4 isoform X2 [Limanda limanda]
MKEEIAAAVFFVARLVKRYGCLDTGGRMRFATALTSALFESYKNHWHPKAPSKGQAYRCLRMNGVRRQDPVLQQACERSAVRYQDLGLPHELTVWVDPGEVSCRYGERSSPFCVSVVDSCRRDGGFSRRVHDAVERASLDIPSGSSDDEEEAGGDFSMSSSSMSNSLSSNSLSSLSSGSSSCGSGSVLSVLCPAPIPANNLEPKTIPTVSNPNSVYRFSEFSPGAPQTWVREKRKAFAGDSYPPQTRGPGSHFSVQKGFKSYRATFTFTGPRVDKYHWVSKSRS